MAFRPNATEFPSMNPRVVPAQVHFLTIYNPTLGDTDEIEKDQIVFWAGEDEFGTTRVGRMASKSPDGRDGHGESVNGRQNVSEEQKVNDKLRHIGLARGMIDFASEHPLDTIETDRSRIVLHELEKDWWILASIDLTRLPPVQTKNDDHSSKGSQPDVEFSAREVSPAFLLRSQLIKAHNMFLLHHAAGLWELYHKLGRATFCAHLNRFWEPFARKWDVLLHGNPAIDVYGDCIKLAGGGELGVGVGEEDWGSGEREVLEGFVERADGLIECVVGRYGEVPPENAKRRLDAQRKKKLTIEDKMTLSAEPEPQPWLGAGEDPGPADGVVFSGVGALSKRSLATVSQWMEAIFKSGDSAYGIGENPSARQRPRRRRPKTERKLSDDQPKNNKQPEQTGAEGHPPFKSSRTKAPDLRRKAMENNAAPPGLPPGIPAPLVGAVERSLDEAPARVAGRSSSKSPKSSPKSSPKQEKSEQEAMNGAASDKEESSSMFSMEGMKNIFTLGYGTNWTLNPNGFEKRDEDSDGDTSKKSHVSESQVSKKYEDGSKAQRFLPGGTPGEESMSPDSSLTRSHLEQSTSGDRPTKQREHDNTSALTGSLVQRSTSGSKPAQERLQEIDPTPEVSDEDRPFIQRLEQSIGRFLIGLSGDLENTEFEDSDDLTNPSDRGRKSRPQRIFLRTLTVELAKTHYSRPGLQNSGRKFSQTSNISKASTVSGGSTRSTTGPEPKTSAAASVDGANPAKRHEKVQVAVYVHQPFIFVFLFELHSPSMTMPSFYRTIHHSLGPLQKPLLQRTDPTRVAERIAGALNEKASAAVTAVRKHVDDNGNSIYDLVHDSFKNTIRASLPNIPVPTLPNSAIKTSSTVSGAWYTLGIPIGTSNSPSTSRLDPVGVKTKAEPWSRVEALNVHTQILNTFAATRNQNELERTVKTARGWWVLWMKISAPGKEVEDLKEAFLVRRSAEFSVSRQGKDGARSNSGAAGRWLLRDQSRDVSNSNNFSGSGSSGSGAKSVSEGVGIDAKKWVEGLLALTQ